MSDKAGFLRIQSEAKKLRKIRSRFHRKMGKENQPN